MSDPVSAREALLIETIGEVVQLMDEVKRQTSECKAISQEIDRAQGTLQASLAGFQDQILALTARSKVVAVKHILERTAQAAQQAAHQSAELQSKAMADAARVAFGAQVGAALQRLQALTERPAHPWEPWLMHAATATAASLTTWMLTTMTWTR